MEDCLPPVSPVIGPQLSSQTPSTETGLSSLSMVGAAILSPDSQNNNRSTTKTAATEKLADELQKFEETSVTETAATEKEAIPNDEDCSNSNAEKKVEDEKEGRTSVVTSNSYVVAADQENLTDNASSKDDGETFSGAIVFGAENALFIIDTILLHRVDEFLAAVPSPSTVNFVVPVLGSGPDSDSIMHQFEALAILADVGDCESLTQLLADSNDELSTSNTENLTDKSDRLPTRLCACCRRTFASACDMLRHVERVHDTKPTIDSDSVDRLESACKRQKILLLIRHQENAETNQAETVDFLVLKQKLSKKLQRFASSTENSISVDKLCDDSMSNQCSVIIRPASSLGSAVSASPKDSLSGTVSFPMESGPGTVADLGDLGSGTVASPRDLGLGTVASPSDTVSGTGSNQESSLDRSTLKLPLADSSTNSPGPMKSSVLIGAAGKSPQSNSPTTTAITTTAQSRSPGQNPMCHLHPDGKVIGVECPKCDTVLGSSRSLGGHITMMHSRNSCKTLKCPKCNWHYKYQETLEIHMKEKHPDNDVTCLYCLTNQTHPRLSRGETYGCGYKPYRCDICKYSTTTKGNLSIHMQSDKHLNNVQELQQGKIIADPTALIHAQSSSSSSVSPPALEPSPNLQPPIAVTAPVSQSSLATPPPPKSKPSWRCDVCNYETNVARNLRIHMTSEKHTHNALLLQQQELATGDAAAAALATYAAQTLAGLQQQLSATVTAGFGDATDIESHLRQQLQLSTTNRDRHTLAAAMQQQSTSATTAFAPDSLALLQSQQLQLLGPITARSKLFQCCVCCVFSCDSFEELLTHLHADRSRPNESDVTMLAGNYLCNLCQYKTHLKANFQLHTKTDKHLQKLQLVNHIREGGPNNEWRVQYLTTNNPVQLRCNACYEFTNRHTDSFTKLTQALQTPEGNVITEEAGKWIQIREIQDNDPVEITGEDDGRSFVDELEFEEGSEAEGRDAFSMNEDAVYCCSECSFTCSTEDMIDDHMVKVHHHQNGAIEGSSSVGTACLTCPLCLCPQSRSSIESHLTEVHKVSPEGVQRLLPSSPETAISDSTSKDSFMISQVNNKRTGKPITGSGTDSNCFEDPDSTSKRLSNDSDLTDPDSLSSMTSSDNEGVSTTTDVGGTPGFACPLCSVPFATVDELYSHQSDVGHLEVKSTPRGPGYLCWQKGCNQYFSTVQSVQMHFREIHAKRMLGTISEHHAYKFRCSQCALAFQTEAKLKNHAKYHLIRDATKCVICQRSFRSVESLKRHVETSHVNGTLNGGGHNVLELNGVGSSSYEGGQTNEDEIDLGSLSPTQTVPLGESGSSVDLDEYLNSAPVAEGNYNDPSRKFKCHRCKLAFTKQTYLTAHNKTLYHRRGEKVNYSMEKFLDPSRPFKCEICRESFTQKNIMLVHFNSVAHLNKLNKTLRSPNFSPNVVVNQSGEIDSNNSVRPSATQATSTFSLCNGNSFTSSSAYAGGLVSTDLPNTLKRSTTSNATTVKHSVSGLPNSANHSAAAGRASQSGLTDHAPPNSQKAAHKPFRCNICNAAYSQSSTLDIHLRSVGHHSRAARLPELVVAGDVDASQPLIERGTASVNVDAGTSATSSVKKQHQQQHSGMLTATSLANSNATAAALQQQYSQLMTMANLAQFAPFFAAAPGGFNPQLALLAAATGQTGLTAGLTGSTFSAPNTVCMCSSCGLSFGNVELMEAHQKKCAASALVSSTVATPKSAVVTPTTEQGAAPRCDTPEDDWFLNCASLDNGGSSTRGRIPRNKMFWRLLEDYGSEVVMQHNESARNKRKSTTPMPVKAEQLICEDEFGFGDENELNNEFGADEFQDSKRLKIDETCDAGEDNKENNEKCNSTNKSTAPTGTVAVGTGTELKKCVCQRCNSEFSSVWVLKAHTEQFHKEMISTDYLERISDEVKRAYDISTHRSLTHDVSTTHESSLSNELSPPKSAFGSAVDLSTASTSSRPVSRDSTHLTTNQKQPSTTASANHGGPDAVGDLGGQFASLSATQQQQLLQSQLSAMQAMASASKFAGGAPSFLGGFPYSPFAHPFFQFSSGFDMGCSSGVTTIAPSTSQTSLASSSPVAASSAASGCVVSSPMSVAATLAAVAAANNSQKRARTRITDEQLKILREHFDINNSPTDAQVEEMSRNSGLPPKVIKHWFRNTLFKERQRNKDSPYNFNVPPQLGIDLEEYEKTGEARVISLLPETGLPSEQTSSVIIGTAAVSINVKTEATHSSAVSQDQNATTAGKTLSIKAEPMEFGEIDQKPSAFTVARSIVSEQQLVVKPVIKQESPKAAANETQFCRRPDSEISQSQHSNSNSLYTPSPPPHPRDITQQQLAISAALSAQAEAFRRLGTGYNQFPFQDPSGPLQGHPNVSPSLPHESGSEPAGFMHALGALTSPGRRANRTRFSDDQLHVLQDFFEKNAYPKDDDLETLSKQLGLSPRVIVVWFQNARQKARKIYENQPPEGDERFVRTPGLNYQCKKCSLVFQRYYELIKHQRLLCYHDEVQADEMKLMNCSDSTSSNADFSPESPDFSALNPFSDPFKVAFAANGDCNSSEAMGSSNNGSPQKHSLADLTVEYGGGDSGHKRQRTQILPEQLDLLYLKYSKDSNPSGKHLEQISQETGLNKRVVQVWFQNTRARDRRGQLTQQIFCKRCPFCGILLHSKPSMEGHIKERHPDQNLKTEINIDALPDAEEVPTITTVLHDDGPQNSSLDEITQSMLTGTGSSQTGFSSSSDALKRLAEELSASSNSKLSGTTGSGSTSQEQLLYWLQKMESDSLLGTVTSPMDLSRALNSCGLNFTTTPSKASDGSGVEVDAGSYHFHLRTPSSEISHERCDDEFSQDISDNENEDERSNFSYESTSPSALSHGGGFLRPQKRFRTHLSHYQIKIMKQIFDNYKTPTMTECELLGSYINLHKRVVQVWFQNARAKERKARAVVCQDANADIIRPTPANCTLCNITYSPKYTVQDHVFSKAHIDKLKESLKEDGGATQCGGGGHEFGTKPGARNPVLEHLQETIAARTGTTNGISTTAVNKSGSKTTARTPFGVSGSSRGVPKGPAGGAGDHSSMGSTSVALKSVRVSGKTTGSGTSGHKSSGETGQTANGKSGNTPVSDDEASAAALAAQNLLPFLYAAQAQSNAAAANFNPAAYYASLASSLMYTGAFGGLPAGASLLYDPNIHGTPVSMLQIPSQVVQLINERLQNSKNTFVKFTQDGHAASQLKQYLIPTDAACLKEAEVEVGWACRPCNVVFPSNEYFQNHQQMVCQSRDFAFRLIQIHYECSACDEKFGSQVEFRAHVLSSGHKQRTGTK